MCPEETTKEREPREALHRELAGRAEKLPKRLNPRQRAWEVWLRHIAEEMRS